MSNSWSPRRPRGASVPLAMCLVLALALLLSLMRPGCSTGAAESEHHIRLGGGEQQQQQQPAAAFPSSGTGPITLDVPAVLPVDMHMAHLLLPLLNLSSLSTAALLDSKPGISPAEARKLVRLHQDLYCSARMNVPDPPGSARTLFSNVTLFVYEAGDFVSDSLRGAARTWELAEIQQMLYALRTPVPASTSAADLADPSSWRAPASPFFIDIGANVGWFTVNAAAAGARVAAFEAMDANIALLRATMCANPWIAERVALYGTGLGTERTSCVIISDSWNVGDGHVTCGQETFKVLEDWKQKTGREYVARGRINLVRLDSLIDHDVQMVKIDVEGFEPSVFKGAESLLRDHNVWFIATECNADIIKPEGQADFIKFLDAQGYYVSQSAFTGPFIPVEAVRLGYSAPLSGANLFCVKKAMRDAVEAGALQGRRLAAAARGGTAEAGADSVWADWLRRSAAAAAS